MTLPRCSACPRARGFRLAATGVGALILCVLLLSRAPSAGDTVQDAAPWWEAETALSDDDGALVLIEKPWWQQAVSLKTGEHFRLVSALPGGGRMLVRRERLTRHGEPFDALVWVLDDDGDMKVDDTDGDKDSDCYVVDYGLDGRVDRMLDYQDNDGDGQADEMDLRYFVDGQLRRSWFWLDLDRDGHMWYVANYEYGGNNFKSDHYGNNVLFLNKYDPERRAWVPFSECPFAFYDTDGDGESEAVVRVSAVPLGFNEAADPDYANSYLRIDGPFHEAMRRMGIVNIRYSVDVDGGSSRERRLHYDLGFNLVGAVPYDFPGMASTNPLRRPPKTTICVPHADLRQVAESYPAAQTGFSWHEYGDGAVALGAAPHAEEDRRWEGVFWTWNRRIMQNTGGPTQYYNIRREFRPTPSERRELYYSGVDRRIHLKGATEGWLRIGHFGAADAWGELRYFDTDQDGYFDRWETYRSGNPVPVRVDTVAGTRNRDLPADWNQIEQFYTHEVLPEAIRANETLMAVMRRLADFTVPKKLASALAAAACDGERRYVLDVIRESQFLDLRDKLRTRSLESFEAVGESLPQGPQWNRSDPEARRAIWARSSEAWAFARTLSALEVAYGQGRYDEAARLLDRLADQPPEKK